MKQQRGSVLLFTVIFISTIFLVTQFLVRSVLVHLHFDRVMRDKEQAKMVALGGINLAISQLTAHTTKEKRAALIKKDKTNEEKLLGQNLLKRILPSLNLWQVFPLTEKVDGIEGEVKICLSAEDGKININKAFNFSKNEFEPQYAALLEPIAFEGKKKLARGEIVKKITAFLKERGKPIEDISQLLTIDGFDHMQLFHTPPSSTKRATTADKKSEINIALTDLFTVWSSHSKIEVWLLSSAMRAVLDVRSRRANDATERKDEITKSVEQFVPDLGKNWGEHWRVLEPLYEKRPNALPQLQKIFVQQFDPQVYTVISSGTVGRVTQTLLAVLVKKKEKQQEQGGKKESSPKTAEKKELGRTSFNILKIYWIND